MTAAHHTSAPEVDEKSRARLATQGLRMELVDVADTEAFDAWFTAEMRGFYAAKPNAEGLVYARQASAEFRMTGVYDGGNRSPVGTVSSWLAPLTLPGGVRLDSWAISSVTVAPTHRRRGIASALLTAELRTAKQLGVPMAMLTASEAVIYGRWGFGSATESCEWRVDTRRAGWGGGDTVGTLLFVEAESYREIGAAVLDRVMAAHHGEIGLSRFLAERLLAPTKLDGGGARHVLVAYESPAGEPEGFVSYAVNDGDDFTRHVANVLYLAAATDAAYKALWRYLVELDLVAEVRVGGRSPYEPVPMLLSDPWAAQPIHGHGDLWVRVLDVPAVLEARRYERDGALVLEVTDALGLAGGRFELVVAQGVAKVRATEREPSVSLPIEALGSVCLGQAATAGLALTGRITGDAVGLDLLLRTATPPRLTTGF